MPTKCKQRPVPGLAREREEHATNAVVLGFGVMEMPHEYDHECHYARDIRKRGRKPGLRPGVGIESDIQGHDESISENPNHIDFDIVYPDQHLEEHAETLGSASAFTEDHESLDGGSLQSHPPFLRNRNESFDAAVHQPGGDKDGNIAPAVLHAVESPTELPRRTSQFMQDISSVLSPPLPTDTQVVSSRQDRLSFGPSSISSRPVGPKDPGLYKSPLKCLEPVLPLLAGIIGPDEACELLEFYFDEAGSSLFRVASPYVLTHVLRKQSLLHPTKPRETTAALLVTMMWVSAQTAEIPVLLIPGSRPRICDALRRLWMELLEKKDLDHWHWAPGGRLVYRQDYLRRETASDGFSTREAEPPAQTIDDVLTFILLCIVISGSDFKTDCIQWWSKALRAAQRLGLNRQDEKCNASSATCVKISCTSHKPRATETLASIEAQEERRRVFWLLFCLDRHLALSHNGTIAISDDECDVFVPLPDEMWDNLETIPMEVLTRRSYGPSTLVTGIGFFEYFLPLMAILGDIILVHHLKNHPRFGSLDERATTSSVESLLDNCTRSVSDLASRYELERTDGSTPTGELLTPSPNDGQLQDPATSKRRSKSRTQAQLVTTYATFILHVLHVLLHGKWDAVSMLENDDGWITSVEFMKCAFHAIAASSAVSQILRRDPELTFMPYLFGIYLLHGSFILLLFADRMPQLGPNESVEKACETIIRAHEVCVVTLNTEFQKRFRKVLRSTLYSVRSTSPTSEEEIIARRRALSLYRWTKGARGLAL